MESRLLKAFLKVGVPGAREAAAKGDVVAIIDALRASVLTTSALVVSTVKVFLVLTPLNSFPAPIPPPRYSLRPLPSDHPFPLTLRCTGGHSRQRWPFAGLVPERQAGRDERIGHLSQNIMTQEVIP